MTNIPRSWSIDEYLDVEASNYYKAYQEEHKCTPGDLEKLMDVINLLARDNARTPVQWDGTKNGGFTSGKPWMRVDDNYKEINVSSQLEDPQSILSFWKQMLKVRKTYKDLFIYGSFEVLDTENKKTFTYLKQGQNQTAYIVLNFTSEEVSFQPLIGGSFELICSNSKDIVEASLGPYEGRIYLVS